MEVVTELQTNEDDSFYSLFLSKSSKPIQLPEVNELIPTPTPPPPTPQQPPPASPTPSTPTATEKNPEKQTEAQEKELNPPPLEQTPPTETPTPVETHPEEEEYIAIASLDCWRMGKSEFEVERYNMRREPENQLTLRGWTWFRHNGVEALIGREDSDKEYRVNRAVKRDNKCVIDVEDLRTEEKDEIVNVEFERPMPFISVRYEWQ